MGGPNWSNNKEGMVRLMGGRLPDFIRQTEFQKLHNDAPPPAKGKSYDEYVSTYNTSHPAAPTVANNFSGTGMPADADKTATDPNLKTPTIGTPTAMPQAPAPNAGLGSAALPTPTPAAPTITPAPATTMSSIASAPGTLAGGPKAPVQGQLNGVASTAQTGAVPGTPQNPNAKIAAQANQQVGSGQNAFTLPNMAGVKFGGS